MQREQTGEFVEYVDARWPVLVRTAILLGCSPQDAEDLVQTALAGCFRNWHHVRRADDPDAYVYRVLVNALRTTRERRW
ncbi:MAG: hypothetical protein M3419_03385 [Actinomycetota bacterium]|nr:hypothetical protein [Actinomycetota bacterium]